MGVPLFFFISSYLINFSVRRSKDTKDYFKKRFWRIYPELWTGITVEIFTILIFYKAKINWLGLGIFAVTQGTVLQFWTPGFLRGYGCGTPNGSLWTICVTVQFYIIVWLTRKLWRNWGGGKILDCIYSYAYGNRRLHRNCSKVHPRYPLQTLLSDNCTIFVDILAWTFCGGIFGQAASVTEKILVGRNCIFCCMADKID
jgi:Predicted acyltransferases